MNDSKKITSGLQILVTEQNIFCDMSVPKFKMGFTFWTKTHRANPYASWLT